MTVLITADELADELAGARPPVVLDVRWRLDRPDGRSEYLDGHIPGAVYVDLDQELAAHGAPQEGRHPLPPVESLQRAARSWGIREGSLRAWTASDRALESGEVRPVPGDVTLQYGGLPTVDIDGAAGFPEHGVLFDARAAERYRGETEPVDPRAGHIPNAISAPTTENVDAEGRFLDADALRQRFASLGVTEDVEVGVYCGSGVTAAHEAAALTIAGFRPVLYPGSWSQWSNHPDRPVATGAEPGGGGS